MSQSDGSGDAVERLERSITRAVAAGKTIAFASLLTSFLTGRKAIPRAKFAGTLVVLTGVQSLVTVARMMRRGSVDDPGGGRVDAAMAALMIVGEAASWKTRAFPPDPRMGLPHAVTVGAFAPAMISEPSTLMRAMAAPTLAFVVSSSARTATDPTVAVPALRLSEISVLPLTTLLSYRLVSELRRRAREQDHARAAAVDAAARVATERERQRQFRQLHDSALQVLETIAGGWDIDESTLAARIEREIAMLERELTGTDDTLSQLDQAVRELAAEFTDSGLKVDVTSHHPGRADWLRREGHDALLGALREALTNVVKHANTDSASVTVTENRDRVEITVVDRGAGFDPGQVTAGFGLSGSITARMHDVGGNAKVRSTIAQGTEVELWLTRP